MRGRRVNNEQDARGKFAQTFAHSSAHVRAWRPSPPSLTSLPPAEGVSFCPNDRSQVLWCRPPLRCLVRYQSHPSTQ
jgi:hypothetical protein